MSYKSLFIKQNHFEVNGVEYKEKSFAISFYKFVKDVLDGKFGDLPKEDRMNIIFKSIVYLRIDDIPKATKEKKAYKTLGDIYVNVNTGTDVKKRQIEKICNELKLSYKI